MSKILFACFRKSGSKEISPENLKFLSKRLEPDNIKFHDTHITSDNNTIIAIFNPNNSITIEGNSVCLGNMINPVPNWNEPNSQIPDGTYALYRCNASNVEILSDTVGSRTIWYYHDEDKFISATSQRAIIFFLKSFEFNDKVLPWMLATGTLGPGYSWDGRIKMLRGGSKLALDRNTWELEIENSDCVFKQEKRTKHEHYEALKTAIISSFNSLKLDYSKWILPLSGGYDSRSILCMLKDVENLTCVTWGLEESKYQKGNDAYVAKKLADHYDKNHQYYLTDLSNEPIGKIFNRFLVCGEGRVGDIGGYLDGFSIWKDLFENEIHGIIRGDEGFGCESVMTVKDVRKNMRFPLLSDYTNLSTINNFGIPEQEIPDWLNRKEDESIEVWRDRIYYEYEMPVAFAALNDLKLSYVEVINPLLTREILCMVKTLPDDLRTNKRLFKEIMREISPNIEYATSDATATLDNIFNNKEICEEIINELVQERNGSVIPKDFIVFLLEHIVTAKNNSISSKLSLKAKLKKLLPSKVKSFLRSSGVGINMDFRILAFRTYMILKMNKLLVGDSNHSLEKF